jgi:heterodisulfide reductase subunit A-like polyferredoxin
MAMDVTASCQLRVNQRETEGGTLYGCITEVSQVMDTIRTAEKAAAYAIQPLMSVAWNLTTSALLLRVVGCRLRIENPYSVTTSYWMTLI